MLALFEDDVVKDNTKTAISNLSSAKTTAFADAETIQFNLKKKNTD